ncbi:MAG: glyoxalase [Gammaproteobacteria bacterium]|nr:MAG: glyoxalase [Gammaproteobacteria bacterium]
MTHIRLHHVSLLVSDTTRALGFWHELLGLEVDPKRPDLGYPGAWLGLDGGQQIHLLELPNPCAQATRPEHGGRDAHVALQVKDFEAMRLRLQEAGIPFTSSRTGRQALFVRDPDGNAVELIGQSA